MSHAPDSLQDREGLAAYGMAFKAVSKLLREGRSFSGGERNCAFLNCRRKPFANVSAATGLDFADDGRAIGVTDWDQDGDLDLWLRNRTGPRLRLMKNQTIKEGDGNRSFIAMRLRGVESNRDAIGARVTVRLSPETNATANRADTPPIADMVQTVRAGHAFLSQSSKWLHFGLRDGATIDNVSVRWPSGKTQRFASIEPGRRYLLKEGDEPTALATRKRSLALAPSEHTSPPSKPARRIVLANRLPMPLLRYDSTVKRDGDAADASQPQRIEVVGQPLLVTLWASWCQPCVAELKAMTQGADAIRDSHLQVLALSVDGLDAGQSTNRKDADAALRQIKFPFETGMARRELLDKLALVSKLALHRSYDLAVPASYLFDAQGDLAVIYRGPVELSQIQSDLAILDSNFVQRRNQAIPFEGQWLNPPRQLLLHAVGRVFGEAGYDDDNARYVQLEAERFRDQRASASSDDERRELAAQVAAANYNMGLALVSEGQTVEAVPYFRRAIDVQPKHRDALVNLGVLLAKSGDRAEAIPYLERAVAADPQSTLARLNLAAALNATGKFQQAASQYRIVLKTQPDHAPSHAQLGRALVELKDLPGAIQHFKRALKLNPRHLSSALALSWLHATAPDASLRDGPGAVALVGSINRAMQSKNPMVLDILAAAQAEVGNFAAAETSIRRALELIGDRQPGARQVMQARLAKYQAKKPHRDVNGKYP